MKIFNTYIYLLMLMMSTIISISTLSWFTAWVGLEMNLLFLMPLMSSKDTKNYPEPTIKYFIIQSFASAFLLFSILLYSNFFFFSFKNFNSTTSIMISSSLMLKMGAAPFHFWLPEITSGMNWMMIFIILTWQKIAPMNLLNYTLNTPVFFSIIILMSSVIGGLQGLNQNCMRKILTYSSINHIGWMIASLMNSSTLWTYYFITYCILNLNIIFILNKYNIFYMIQMKELFSSNKKMKFMFMTNFLSLGGLPPFIGFFPKWLVVNKMVMNNFYALAVLLIIFSLISLYFYLRITFSTFSLNNEESTLKIFNKIYYTHFFFMTLSLLGMVIIIILNFY